MLERVFVKPDVTSQRLFVLTCTCRGYGLFQALIWLGGYYGESTSSFGRANVLSLRRTRPSRAGQTETSTYEARGAEAPGPTNGRVSPAAKSWAAAIARSIRL